MSVEWFKPHFDNAGNWLGHVPFNLKGKLSNNKNVLVLADYHGQAEWRVVVNGKICPVIIFFKAYVPLDVEEAQLRKATDDKFLKLW